jgi:acyl-coenzyme A synthetase/AMP-(fatty) acid ligase
MFEGVPNYPDPGRYWQIVDDLGANISTPRRPRCAR